MFITKKGLWKIIAIGVIYFVLASICLFAARALNENSLYVWGIILYALCVVSVLVGRYTEGKGKWINSWSRLLLKELRPAAVLAEYARLRNADDLVEKKPSMEILQFAVVAYDALDDRQSSLATVEELIAVAPAKKKAGAELLKVSLLFSYGETEKAEELFKWIQNQKLGLASTGLADTVLKTDRAFALGDYSTVENYYLQALDRSFPKPNNLSKVVAHYQLGKTYEKMQNTEKAFLHYRYCAENGGETAIRKNAIDKLQTPNTTDIQ